MITTTVWSITLNKHTAKKFRKFCKTKGMKLSTKKNDEKKTNEQNIK